MVRAQRKRHSSPLEDDFQPNFEWREEAGAYILDVQLPGFSREQIKVTYVHKSRSMRVTGEKPLRGSAKRLLVNQLFHVPQNCVVEKIHGSFKNDVLTITMPKQQTMQTGTEAGTAGTSQVTPKAHEQKPVKKAGDHDLTTPGTQAPQRPTMEFQDNISKVPPPKPEAVSVPRATTPPIFYPKTQQEIRDVPPPIANANGKKGSPEAPKDPLHPRRQEEDRRVATTDDKRKKAPSGARMPVEKAVGSGNMEMERAKGLMGAAAGAVKKFRTTEMSDEKQLMVNMGVAVVVIAAFSAYVSYNWGYSSGKSGD